MNKKAWYTISNINEIDTPALIVYPDRMRENIQQLKEMIHDTDRLRPHVKTHKTKEVTSLMMAAGINKFKCATIAEAEMLGMCQAADVLLAYQPFGPKLRRFVKLIKNYPDTVFSCLADNLISAEDISQVAVENDITITVFIDLNVGMNRTGIVPGPEAVKLYENVTGLQNIKLPGFHVYDGHIREKNLRKRINICKRTLAPVKAMIEVLVQKGYSPPKLIAGGSPTFPFYAKLNDIECSPGTFIFWDKGYLDTLPEQQFQPAALILTRIISSDETRLCLDLGYKAIASENPIDKRVHFLNAPELKAISHSEEHLVMEAPKGHTWKVGDLLYGLPVHICPSVALYDEAISVVNGHPAAVWNVIARSRKILV